MNIALSGATGFIGSYLTTYLSKKGHKVIPLGRDVFRETEREQLFKLVSECEVIINLAGTPINHRWSSTYKKTIYGSRIIVTRKLVEAIGQSTRTKFFISTSAVGYYPSSGCHDEESKEQGTGFLANLCEQWEREAHKVPAHVRLAITRFGVVLSPQGGAFGQITRTTRFKVASIIGNGRQAFPWIDLKDLARAMRHLIENPELHGIFNFVAPQQLTQKELTHAIARHYHTWITLPVPFLIFRLLYGKASEVITKGQCVIPRKLLQSGFDFESKEITHFLERHD